jgi:hypothetical protein
LPGLDALPSLRGTPATSIGALMGIDADDVLEYCERFTAYGWFDYRSADDMHRRTDPDAGWVTEIGKVAATYLWCGDKADAN